MVCSGMAFTWFDAWGTAGPSKPGRARNQALGLRLPAPFRVELSVQVPVGQPT